ncbi:MAG TPA: response regulator, partial [Gammaproteobacteria bacterium]|nr:response regulator [Gammaproteobacteria bacterium]
NATTRRDMEGNITGVIGIGQDITELRKNENALSQAQKMEAVGQLTGGIAHDFNNLLSIISGNLRFLQQDIGGTSTEIQELFEDAMSAADDGAELTQRLLAFSRNRALKPEIKNVNDTIEKFIRFLSRTLGENIELMADLPTDDLFINVDPSQLENALLNLSLNARDAMPEGGKITINTIRYHHSHSDSDSDRFILADGNYININIIDTGMGITSKNLQHVYEPFFTTKDVGKGSGLGLSMVYGFTQQSKGACYISSTPGNGTTISMYFPEEMEGKSKDVDTKEECLHGEEVILVVEDEPRVRRVTLRDLKKLGYKTLEAENAAMAVSIIESREDIDLLFSDVLMPGEIDGHMLGVWTEENHPKIKVILTSGFSKGKTDANKDQAHLFPLLRKPYTIDKLAKLIRTTLLK